MPCKGIAGNGFGKSVCPYAAMRRIFASPLRPLHVRTVDVGDLSFIFSSFYGRELLSFPLYGNGLSKPPCLRQAGGFLSLRSRRGSTTCIGAGVPSRRIQDFLSINDGGGENDDELP